MQLSEKDNAFDLEYDEMYQAMEYFAIFLLTSFGSKSLIPNVGKRQHQSGAEVTEHDV